MTTAAKKAATTSSKDEGPDEGESAFKDVSGAVEQAQKDAEAPIEYDEDGNPKPQSSEAANEVNQEMATRASASAEGGGPWPEEVLRERFISPGQRLRAPQEEYTSHEDAE
jgi:hypothetical protein